MRKIINIEKKKIGIKQPVFLIADSRSRVQSPGFASRVTSQLSDRAKYFVMEFIKDDISLVGRYDGVPPPQKMLFSLGLLSTELQVSISDFSALM